jgi:mercuric ion transport protein
MKRPGPETVSFVAGAGSAMAASACCVLPAILGSLGIGAAWVSELRAMERFFPVFVGIAAAAFIYGFYRIYIRSAPCEPGNTRATRQAPPRQRAAFWGAFVFAIALLAIPFLR